MKSPVFYSSDSSLISRLVNLIQKDLQQVHYPNLLTVQVSSVTLIETSTKQLVPNLTEMIVLMRNKGYLW